MSLPAFAHWLPYWTWRDVKVSSANVAVLVLVDGTLVTAFESSGADVYSSDNTQVNRNAASLRRALNVLPADGFLQSEWQTGLSSADLIASFEQSTEGPGQLRAPRGVAGILIEQRRARARMLRSDPTVRRGRLVVYVGQRRALGALSSHRGPRRGLFKAFASLLGGGTHPQEIDGATFMVACERLAETAMRVRDELSSFGARLAPLSGDALLGEIHRAVNAQTALTSSIRAADVPDRALEVDASALADPEFAMCRPLSLREQLPLGDLVWTEEHFTLDDPPVLSRALSLQRLPAFTKPDLLMGAQFATGAPMRLVSTFIATDREKLTERLIRKRNIAHAQAVGIVRDVAADVAFSEYERVLEKMLTEDQRVFHASMTAVVHAGDFDELDRATRELKDAFADAGMAVTTETGRQLGAYLGSLPGNGFAAPRQHQLITNNAADLIPTFNPSAGDEDAQLLYHTRQWTLRKMSFRPSKLRANENVLVFGGSGSGKSFQVACAMEQAFLVQGAPVLIVDVQGPELSSYKVLAELFGGRYTALASNGDAAFSPFIASARIGAMRAGQIAGREAISDDEDALRFMSTIVCVMALPEIEMRREKAFALEIAREAIIRAYASCAARGEDAPLLSDVVDELKVFHAEHDEHAIVAREMYLQLLTWLKDPVRARLMNRRASHSDMGLRVRHLRDGARGAHVPLQVFDFFGMEKDKDLATVLLLSVSFSIWQALKAYPRDQQKLVVFDECWKLLTNQTASDIVAELFRTGRKWGASTWAITQNLADFQASPIHKAVLNNAAMMFLMQHAGDHDAVAEVCGLNDREASMFRQLKMKKGAFSEMLFVDRGAPVAGQRAAILRLVPTPCDLWLNTTDPTDVGLRDRVCKDRGLTLLEAVRFCAEHYPTGAPKRGAARDAKGGGGR